MTYLNLKYQLGGNPKYLCYNPSATIVRDVCVENNFGYNNEECIHYCLDINNFDIQNILQEVKELNKSINRVEIFDCFN